MWEGLAVAWEPQHSPEGRHLQTTLRGLSWMQKEGSATQDSLAATRGTALLEQKEGQVGERGRQEWGEARPFLQGRPPGEAQERREWPGNGVTMAPRSAL